MRKLATFYSVLILLFKQYSFNDKVIVGQESGIQDFDEDEPPNDYPYDYDDINLDKLNDYLCGDIIISENSACICGSDELSHEDLDNQYCCSNPTCLQDQNGDVNCVNGNLLQRSQSCNGGCRLDRIEQDFKCGDICITIYNDCYCGPDSKISSYDVNYYDTQCLLPSEKDTCYHENGDGFCINGTTDEMQMCGGIEMQRSKSCNGTCKDVSNDRGHHIEMFGCATTGDNCVDPTKLCHGYSVCDDKSDLEFCNKQHCQYKTEQSFGIAVSCRRRLNIRPDAPLGDKIDLDLGQGRGVTTSC